MHPSTHLLTGWLVANGARLTPRERALVTVAGILPDFDGLGVFAEVATRGSSHPLLWWSNYHHLLGHNLLCGLCAAGLAFALSTRRWMTAGLVFAAFHLHLLEDVVGARGPDGDQWPIPYLWPFSDRCRWVWNGQWALNAWPNFAITMAMLAIMFRLAFTRGYSPLEMVSKRVDKAFVDTLRQRFGFRHTSKPD